MERIEQAVDAGDFAAAVAQAVALWHLWPARALSDLVVALDARLPDVALEGGTDDWLRRVADASPAELGPLCRHLPGPTRAETWTRWAALAARAPDPRIGATLERLVATMPYTSDDAMRGWAEVFASAPALQDPRLLGLEAVAAALAVRSRMKAWLAKQLSSCVRSMHERGLTEPPALDAEAGARLTRLAAAARPPDPADGRPLEAPLLAAVWAEPASPGPRLVYADWLTELGDPRGELIRLQHLEAPSKVQLRRIRALVREHGRRWLGDLEPACAKTPLAFSRGFPSEVAVQWRDGRLVAALGRHPAWATLERLVFPTSANAKGQYAPRETLEWLQWVPPTAVSVRWLGRVSEWGVRHLLTHGTIRGLEGLDVWLSEPRLARELAASGLMSQLRELRAAGSEESVAALVEGAPMLERLTARVPYATAAHLASLRGFDPDGTSKFARVRFEVGADGRLSVARITLLSRSPFPHLDVANTLRDVPDDALTRIVLEPSEAADVTAPAFLASLDLSRHGRVAAVECATADR